VLVHHIVLALAPGEINPRHTLVAGEAVNRSLILANGAVEAIGMPNC
jgi:hypothetical protein